MIYSLRKRLTTQHFLLSQQEIQKFSQISSWLCYYSHPLMQTFQNKFPQTIENSYITEKHWKKTKISLVDKATNLNSFFLDQIWLHEVLSQLSSISLRVHTRTRTTALLLAPLGNKKHLHKKCFISTSHAVGHAAGSWPGIMRREDTRRKREQRRPETATGVLNLG